MPPSLFGCELKKSLESAHSTLALLISLKLNELNALVCMCSGVSVYFGQLWFCFGFVLVLLYKPSKKKTNTRAKLETKKNKIPPKQRKQNEKDARWLFDEP